MQENNIHYVIFPNCFYIFLNNKTLIIYFFNQNKTFCICYTHVHVAPYTPVKFRFGQILCIYIFCYVMYFRVLGHLIRMSFKCTLNVRREVLNVHEKSFFGSSNVIECNLISCTSLILALFSPFAVISPGGRGQFSSDFSAVFVHISFSFMSHFLLFLCVLSILL